MLPTTGRQAERDMFRNKGICQQQERHTEIVQLLNHSTYFETSDKMESRDHQEEEKGRLSQYSRKRCFLGSWFSDAPHFRKGSAFSVISHSVFKNPVRLQINKSRSYCSCEIRQASVPPPFLRTSRKRSPFKPSYLLSN